MDETFVVSEQPPVPERRGRPVLAWSVVLLALVAIAVLGRARATDGPESARSMDTIIIEMQARYLVGAANLLPQQPPQALYEQAKPLNTGTVDQRLRFVVLAGELAGPDEALAQLRDLENKITKNGTKLTDEQREVSRLLSQLYRDYENGKLDGPPLSPTDRQRLVNELGWLGKLALQPKGGPSPAERAKVLAPARRMFAVLIAAFFGYGMLGVCGLGALVTVAVLALSKRLPGGLHIQRLFGGIYAETFAVWFVLYLALAAAAARLPGAKQELWIPAVISFLSLGALAWPRLRGVPWSQMKEDLGLNAGRRPALEPLIGLGCYAMMLPLLCVGLLITLLLIQLQNQFGAVSAEGEFGRNALPVHPIVLFLSEGGWWSRLQVFLLASIAAPVVEETIFRGVLYRHLREATARLRVGLSIFLSAFLNSLIFAVIHPQGLLAVPALVSIAIGLTLAREWRGTLIPSMVAHGLHNGMLMLLAMLALS